jgi:hypothetical protein
MEDWLVQGLDRQERRFQEKSGCKGKSDGAPGEHCIGVLAERGLRVALVA